MPEKSHAGRHLPASIRIRALGPDEVDEADRIMRTAFGTFLGAPEPMKVFGDAQWIRPRFAAAPDWAWARRC